VIAWRAGSVPGLERSANARLPRRRKASICRQRFKLLSSIGAASETSAPRQSSGNLALAAKTRAEGRRGPTPPLPPNEALPHAWEKSERSRPACMWCVTKDGPRCTTTMDEGADTGSPARLILVNLLPSPPRGHFRSARRSRGMSSKRFESPSCPTVMDRVLPSHPPDSIHEWSFQESIDGQGGPREKGHIRF